ncbi:MAG: HTH domain-containing protein [Prolixibacteraceae bacterium]
MNKLLQHIQLIERVDQLIRLRATGSPRNLARRLAISEASLYRLIETLREMGAPIEFSVCYQSYVYSSEVKFICGFFQKELSNKEIQIINGGVHNLALLLDINKTNFFTVNI